MKQQVEIVQESEDSTSDLTDTRTRSRSDSHPRSSSDRGAHSWMSNSVSPPSSHSPEEVPCRPEVPLETDDDDEPLLNFGGVGVGSLFYYGLK